MCNIGLKLKQSKGKLLQKLFPGVSCCHRCLHPWINIDHRHTVEYDHGSGHFALCETCWKETTIEEKIKYYTQSEQIKWYPDRKKTITDNILIECGIEPQSYYRDEKIKSIGI